MTDETIQALQTHIEKIIGHPLADPTYLQMAVTHRSYANESTDTGTEDNERLEFLGDSVLNLAVSDLLMVRYPTEPEGNLSKYRSAIVNEKSLAEASRSLDLGRYLRLGKGEEQTQGRDKDSILADAFEAVVAAVYLSGNLKDAAAFVRAQLEDLINLAHDETTHQDFKTMLQELVQRNYKTTPVYELVTEDGPDHDKTFEAQVLINKRSYGTGKAKSKKDAEQKSAEEALLALQDEIAESDPNSPHENS